jgi:hypothetical protein
MTDRKNGTKTGRAPAGKAGRKGDPAATRLDPSHPNHDAILLRRARLEAHRKRRKENAGVATAALPTTKKSDKRGRPAD